MKFVPHVCGAQRGVDLACRSRIPVLGPRADILENYGNWPEPRLEPMTGRSGATIHRDGPTVSGDAATVPPAPCSAAIRLMIWRAAMAPASWMVSITGRSSQFSVGVRTPPILMEGGQDLAEQRERGLVGNRLGVVGVAPEIMAGRLGFRRDGIEVALPETAFRRRLIETGEAEILTPRRVGRTAGGKPHETRWAPFDDLPAVDDPVARPSEDLLEARRRRGVDDPARDGHRVPVTERSDLGGLGNRRRPNRRLVHEGQM